MITEQGRVDALADGFAWVVCRRQAGCERCAEGHGCGGGLLGRWLGDRLHRVQAVVRSGDVRVGDTVLLGLEPAALVRGALIAYGIPLGALLVGAVLGNWIYPGQGDLPAIVAAMLGLLSALLIVRRYSRRLLLDPRYQPVVLGRMSGCASSRVSDRLSGRPDDIVDAR